MPFGFDITDDGDGHFLLVYYSMDRAYAADTWHETLSDAYFYCNRFSVTPLV
jgi:hypothetical protein